MTKRKAYKKSARRQETQKQSLYERISKSLDIPPDLSPSSTMITIRGRSSVAVSGNTSISLYSPEEIRLTLCKGSLSIKGEGLACISYHIREVSVEGRINSISFEEEC